MSKRKTETTDCGDTQGVRSGHARCRLMPQTWGGQLTFYKWRAKYGGMEASEVHRLKELEEENRRLKQMYADLSLKSMLQEEIIKKL